MSEVWAEDSEGWKLRADDVIKGSALRKSGGAGGDGVEAHRLVGRGGVEVRWPRPIIMPLTFRGPNFRQGSLSKGTTILSTQKKEKKKP